MTAQAIEIARRIEHTLLRPEATPEQIDRLCDEAVEFGFCGVCVNPVFVARAAARLEKSRKAPRTGGPIVVSVVGFPLGCTPTAVKIVEALGALNDGATEIDMVIHVGALIAGDVKAVRTDIESLAHMVHGAARPGQVAPLLKVILETAALSEAQIISGCRCCAEGEADFVKTSTGFHPAGGATVEHVRLLHRYGAPMRVKAAGGIRDAAAALAMVEAGADRIGASASVAIVRGIGELKPSSR